MTVCSRIVSTDSRLAAGVLSGNRVDFDRLYEKYFSNVYRYAFKRLRDEGEAEDMTQEVFMGVLQSLPSYRGEAPLLHWIYGIARNKVNYHLRRKSTGRDVRFQIEDICLEGFDVPVDRVAEARRLLCRCDEVSRADLTDLDRRILTLRHLESQSIRAIAGELGRSEDAIKAKLYRIRQFLSSQVPGLESVL